MEDKDKCFHTGLSQTVIIAPIMITTVATLISVETAFPSNAQARIKVIPGLVALIICPREILDSMGKRWKKTEMYTLCTPY